jgi:Ni,Fe-hydrogenase III small subunit/Pyruvate/2-oxoacid:ferredoxin oxidoreductase delta subunit
MIGDVIRQSLGQRDTVIPVEALLGNCNGSRMPHVVADRLTPTTAHRTIDACPTAALGIEDHAGRRCLRLSYGRCIGCGRCIEAGDSAVILVKNCAYLGVAKEHTVRLWDIEGRGELTAPAPTVEMAREVIHSLLQRALNVRQLDAGSCNGCEAEITALANPYYDLERFGIHFVASPKHADMLLVTGPVTRNMADAVRATYEAVPAPKLVVAVGACGCSGGIFAGSHAISGGVDTVIPVDGYIPGCPPTPAMLLTGILEVLRRHCAK